MKEFALLLVVLLLLNIKQAVTKEQSAAINARAKRSIKLLTPCLRYERTYLLSYPEDADAHYAELLSRTEKYRNLKPHKGSGNFAGPWIENHFITHFLDKPLSYFGGIFPLFVQWSDYQLANKHNSTDMAMFEQLRAFLRPDVLYLAVSQANQGLEIFMKSDPNVLVMSAGGDGNIPIPLIKGELKFVPTAPEFPLYDLGFYGSPDHGPRKMLLGQKEIIN